MNGDHQGHHEQSWAAWIKSKATAVVKAAAYGSFVLLLTGDAWSAPPKNPERFEDYDVVPPITARKYDTKVVRMSQSRKMYLFEVTDSTLPKAGRMILLKNDQQPVMAFRCLKVFPGKKQFAGKRVKSYSGGGDLPIGQSYHALEKLTEVTAPRPTPEDRRDLDELEFAPYPLVEPSGKPGPRSSFSTDPNLDEEDALTLEENQDLTAMTVDEVSPLDPNLHWLTFSFGFLRNVAIGTKSTYFTGGGLRYGRTLFRSLIFTGSKLQDSLVAEAGVFYYKIANYALPDGGDTFDVLPFSGTLRYNFVLSEGTMLFIYGGAIYHTVLSYSPKEDPTVYETRRLLQRLLPAAGGGLSFVIGPGWNIRLDAGIDMIGAGLMLRF